MAWDHYLNMEPLALEIAKDHAKKMSNSNFLKDNLDLEGHEPIPDEFSFLKNFKLGFVAITMASCFVESSLNTLLREHLGYHPESKAIHGTEECKLAILFKEKTSELKKIKSSHRWRNWKRIKKVINTLLHYKNNSPGFMSSYPLLDQWEIGDEIIGFFFTKDKISKLIDDVEYLMKEILTALDMTINPSCISFGSDGRCGMGSYYCTQEEADCAIKNELNN